MREVLEESFKLWLWQRMIKVKQTDRVRKDEVLRRTGEERKLLKVIRNKNILVWAYIAQTLSAARNIEGKAVGKKECGKRKMKYLMTSTMQ